MPNFNYLVFELVGQESGHSVLSDIYVHSWHLNELLALRSGFKGCLGRSLADYVDVEYEPRLLDSA